LNQPNQPKATSLGAEGVWDSIA